MRYVELSDGEGNYIYGTQKNMSAVLIDENGTQYSITALCSQGWKITKTSGKKFF
jgi:hypothetical protein